MTSFINYYGDDRDPKSFFDIFCLWSLWPRDHQVYCTLYLRLGNLKNILETYAT